ncbi:hypothetical protein MKZ38_010464 [Zalerion maritima]|uniref:DNA repair protein Rad26 n=1 Tax=Zalerion maritima TaxID=339359 RepID=A0AAD5RFY8_9PEZI|nr:hypothetical protein MKZ38_010464 [Zalerion maritima]
MDGFSDDDLDGLDADELANLESNAVQATQAVRENFLTQTTQLDLNYIDLTEDNYYGGQGRDYDASRDAPRADSYRPARNSAFMRPPPPHPVTGDAPTGSGRVVPVHRRQTSGFPPYKPPIQRPSVVGGGPNAAASSCQTTYNTSAYNRRYGQPQHQQYQQPIGTQFTRPPLPGSQAPIHASHFQHPLPRSTFAPDASQDPPSATQNNMVEALKNRIRALEADLNSARGEISIVRSKHNKSKQDHDQDLQQLKKFHADQLARQEEIARMAQRAEETAATELEFARRDLREGVSRAQRKDVTPKKSARSFGVGDGFNDSDLAPSPSKSLGRFRNVGSVALPIALAERTPSKAKRKRPAADSPLKPLELEDGDVIMGENSQPKSLSQNAAQPSISQSKFSHDHIKMLLEHRTARNRLGTFEVMSKYSLPDKPDMPFTNIYLHKIPEMGDPSDPLSLLSDFALFTLELWNDCLAQQYYEPVMDLLSLVTFTLHLNLDVVPRILCVFLPVAQNTCLTIVIPRFEASEPIELEDEYHTKLSQYIDVGRIVSVLHFAALACASAPLDTTNPVLHQFWCLVEPKLVVYGLSPKQPFQDYLAIVRLVQTSALPGSIGPISTTTPADPKATPEAVADLLIERLTSHLRLRQSWGKTLVERYRFTLTILHALTAFSASPFGLSRFLSPPRALARLVCLVCAYVDELYQSDVPLQLALKDMNLPEYDGDDDSDDMERPPVGSHAQPTVYDVISSAMLLLHTVITNPKVDVISQLKPRLETISASWERYLITLARLEFAEEDLILERGIDSRTLDLAHDLLDHLVTPNPELGEQIVALFGDDG